MKILVVDDEPAVRRALEGALAGAGYDVAVASDGAEALAFLRERGAADAVVLDVLMPEVDGLEACRRLRAGGNDVPV
ncbi:MAG: response regulator transcription factor, partial [Gaiellaceae bacterium]